MLRYFVFISAFPKYELEHKLDCAILRFDFFAGRSFC